MRTKKYTKDEECSSGIILDQILRGIEDCKEQNKR